MTDDDTRRLERLARSAARDEMYDHMEAFHRELREGFDKVHRAIADGARHFAASEERRAAFERRVVVMENDVRRHLEQHTKGQRWLVRSVAGAIIATAAGALLAIFT